MTVADRRIVVTQEKLAKSHFDAALAVWNAGNLEYAIDLYLRGLALDPDVIEAHARVRELGLIRKSRGGPPLGFFECVRLRPKLRSGDRIERMLARELQLAYDPGNMGYLREFAAAASEADCDETAAWAGRIVANAAI